MIVPCISEKMSIRNWVTFCGIDQYIQYLLNTTHEYYFT